MCNALLVLSFGKAYSTILGDWIWIPLGDIIPVVPGELLIDSKIWFF
jgi:hypothetical protein